MEIIRSHIREAFTEDSDPIKDLDIGIFNTGDLVQRFKRCEYDSIEGSHLYLKLIFKIQKKHYDEEIQLYKSKIKKVEQKRDKLKKFIDSL